MNKTVQKIGQLIFSLIGIAFVLITVVGCVLYFADEIQDASWEKLCFYSVIIIFIAFKLGIIFQDLLEFVIKLVTQSGRSE